MSTTQPQMNAQNHALFITFCMRQHNMSRERAEQAAASLKIPADFDNDAFRYVTLRELAKLETQGRPFYTGPGGYDEAPFGLH